VEAVTAAVEAVTAHGWLLLLLLGLGLLLHAICSHLGAGASMCWS
jgi:hypothetical protein